MQTLPPPQCRCPAAALSIMSLSRTPGGNSANLPKSPNSNREEERWTEGKRKKGPRVERPVSATKWLHVCLSLSLSLYQARGRGRKTLPPARERAPAVHSRV